MSLAIHNFSDDQGHDNSNPILIVPRNDITSNIASVQKIISRMEDPIVEYLVGKRRQSRYRVVGFAGTSKE